MIRYLGFFVASVMSMNAHAYLGPGVAGGALVSFIGIILFIFLSLFAIIFYPIKRALKARQRVEAKHEVDD